MHYAAELAKTLVKKCPLLLGLRTAEQVEPEKIRRLLPAELAVVEGRGVIKQSEYKFLK